MNNNVLGICKRNTDYNARFYYWLYGGNFDKFMKGMIQNGYEI